MLVTNYNKPMIHIDKKVTAWERFTIEDDEREALMEFLKANPEATAEALDEWAADIEGEHETLGDTDECMTPGENDGQATIEIMYARSDNQTETLWDNTPKGESVPVAATITEVALERLECLAANTKKEFAYDKHTGTWSWCDRDDGGVPQAIGFSSRRAALLDAIEPYLNPDEC